MKERGLSRQANYCDVSRVPRDTVELYDDLQGKCPLGKSVYFTRKQSCICKVLFGLLRFHSTVTVLVIRATHLESDLLLLTAIIVEFSYLHLGSSINLGSKV